MAASDMSRLWLLSWPRAPSLTNDCLCGQGAASSGSQSPSRQRSGSQQGCKLGQVVARLGSSTVGTLWAVLPQYAVLLGAS